MILTPDPRKSCLALYMLYTWQTFKAPSARYYLSDLVLEDRGQSERCGDASQYVSAVSLRTTKSK